MSWIKENSSLTFFQRFCIKVLKCGPVPRHVAFIMDGNRRYASKANVQKVVGHSKGFEKLSETLMWCKEIGIAEVTVYAFSIENFKRSDEEVQTLMDLAREKFTKLLEEINRLNENGVCIRIIGNLSLLPNDLRKLISQAVLQTKDNKKAFLNVAFAYTSSDEIVESLRYIAGGVQKGRITPDDITAKLISECMYSRNSPPPDILIRTSGEVRLSDFLLWQSVNTDIIFSDVLWPDYSVWHLMGGVFQYQRSMAERPVEKEVDGELSCKARDFVTQLTNERLNQLVEYAKQ